MSNSSEYPAPPPATSRIRLVLLATWAALTVAAIGFVVAVGSNCPNADEWEFVPALTGHEPLGPWLWAQHNEHRLPLPRLVYYCLFQITHDFRTGSVLQIALLSATSLGLMTLAARLRGQPYWTDVFFPVSIVHVGHWENLLIGYNICFAFILVLETALGLVAMFSTRETRFRSGLFAGVLMVLLCLCGGGGVVAAMPVALWLVYLAIQEWKGSRSATVREPEVSLPEESRLANPIDAGASPEEKVRHLQKLTEVNQPLVDAFLREVDTRFGTRSNSAGAKSSILRAAVLLAFAAFPFFYLAIYLQGYHRPEHHPELGDGGFDVVRVTGQVLSMALGYGTFRSWIPIFAGMLLLGWATLYTIAGKLKAAESRAASLGLIAVVAGILGVAFVIGMGRAGLDGRNGLASRYTYLTWPLLALTAIFWTSRGGWSGKWIPALLCVAAALAFPANMISGLYVGSKVRAVLATVEQEAHEGVPPEQIVRHFRGTFQAEQEERAIRAIPMLREAGVGAFAEGRR